MKPEPRRECGARESSSRKCESAEEGCEVVARDIVIYSCVVVVVVRVCVGMRSLVVVCLRMEKDLQSAEW